MRTAYRLLVGYRDTRVVVEDQPEKESKIKTIHLKVYIIFFFSYPIYIIHRMYIFIYIYIYSFVFFFQEMFLRSRAGGDVLV